MRVKRLVFCACYRDSLAWGGGCGLVGGAEEIRTPDLRRAKAALSQLSYGPIHLIADKAIDSCLVGHGGLEPPTSVLSGPRSNQLS